MRSRGTVNPRFLSNLPEVPRLVIHVTDVEVAAETQLFHARSEPLVTVSGSAGHALGRFTGAKQSPSRIVP
jgi:hypothetical protein